MLTEIDDCISRTQFPGHKSVPIALLVPSYSVGELLTGFVSSCQSLSFFLHSALTYSSTNRPSFIGLFLPLRYHLLLCSISCVFHVISHLIDIWDFFTILNYVLIFSFIEGLYLIWYILIDIWLIVNFSFYSTITDQFIIRLLSQFECI